MTQIQLHLGDCIEFMKTLPDQSIDTVITDPPYGVSACKWDTVIPFEPMWEQLKRVTKPRGAIVLFCTQPFTSALVMSNPKWFKYSWVWDKNRGNGHLVAKYRPLQQTEDIAVFCRGATTYNPVMVERDKPRKFDKSPTQTKLLTKQILSDDYTRPDYTHRYPTNLQKFSWSIRGGLHPTQKPVDLLEYLVRTYTNEGETVLDFTCGSGTTGVACVQTGRNFVGCDNDENSYNIAEKRIAEAQAEIAA